MRSAFRRPASGRAIIRRNLPILGALAALALIVLIPDAAPAGEADPVEGARGRIVAFIEPPPEEDPPAPGELPTFDPDATLPPDPGEDPGTDPADGVAGDVEVLLLDGPRAGETVEAFLAGPVVSASGPGYRVGDEVVVSFRGDPSGVPFVSVVDRWRLPVLALLAAVFIVAVSVVGGARGIRALIGLALTIALIVKVVVPQLIAGAAPVPLALLAASFVTLATIGLTEGLGRTSLAAISGTVAALAVTALLAALITELGGFTAAAGEDLAFLEISGQAFDLRGLLLGAFMLGALGVLDDVTVTQAATVEELAARTDLRGRELYMSALRVGRSHIAATVNTLFLAYAGAALPLLVLFVLRREPGVVTLNSEIVAIEVVRTLVGSLGIVSAVPLTTAFATWLADRRPPAVDERDERGIFPSLTRHRG